MHLIISQVLSQHPKLCFWSIYEGVFPAHRRSTCFSVSRRKVCSVSTVSLFPAIHSLSTAGRRSSTDGTCVNSLKDRPRYASLCREPSSTGRLDSRFPSNTNVCRLTHSEKTLKTPKDITGLMTCRIKFLLIFWHLRGLSGSPGKIPM